MSVDGVARSAAWIDMVRGGAALTKDAGLLGKLGNFITSTSHGMVTSPDFLAKGTALGTATAAEGTVGAAVSSVASKAVLPLFALELGGIVSDGVKGFAPEFWYDQQHEADGTKHGDNVVSGAIDAVMDTVDGGIDAIGGFVGDAIGEDNILLKIGGIAHTALSSIGYSAQKVSNLLGVVTVGASEVEANDVSRNEQAKVREIDKRVEHGEITPLQAAMEKGEITEDYVIALANLKDAGLVSQSDIDVLDEWAASGTVSYAQSIEKLCELATSQQTSVEGQSGRNMVSESLDDVTEASEAFKASQTASAKAEQAAFEQEIDAQMEV